ncbi:hypothetical protein EVAR_17619_1 [Eumeta japonica]|uniref:Uncharacterized protein n=1 Tax=Eumeta variegata TaxID=151549 RepID=A0A4C1UC98_EUMVA|nr:hypothetical protein EVAR_17619_1 [Eumeta japonica]
MHLVENFYSLELVNNALFNALYPLMNALDQLLRQRSDPGGRRPPKINDAAATSLTVNCYLGGGPQSPFGGFKDSGLGRESRNRNTRYRELRLSLRPQQSPGRGGPARECRRLREEWASDRADRALHTYCDDGLIPIDIVSGDRCSGNPSGPQRRQRLDQSRNRKRQVDRDAEVELTKNWRRKKNELGKDDWKKRKESSKAISALHSLTGTSMIKVQIMCCDTMLQILAVSVGACAILEQTLERELLLLLVVIIFMNGTLDDFVTQRSKQFLSRLQIDDSFLREDVSSWGDNPTFLEARRR